MKTAWIGGIASAITVIVGFFTLPSLPPQMSLLILIPTFLAGIGLVVQSSAGRGLGFLGNLLSAESLVHHLLVLLGWAAITVGVLGMTKLAPAGASVSLQLSNRLDSFCQHAQKTRAERDLLPVLQALHQQLQNQQGSVRETGITALREHLPRCAVQTAEAFKHPKGTHTSWRKLRRWMVDHPTYIELDPDLRDAPYRPLRHRPVRPLVQLDFGP